MAHRSTTTCHHNPAIASRYLSPPVISLEFRPELQRNYQIEIIREIVADIKTQIDCKAQWQFLRRSERFTMGRPARSAGPTDSYGHRYEVAGFVRYRSV